METLGQQVREIFATDLCFRDQMCRYVESVIGGVRGAGNAENVMQIISVYGMEAMRCSADRIRELVLDRIRFGICRAVARGELPPEIEENRAALLLWALLNPAMIAYMRDAGEEHSVEQAVDTVLYGLCSAGKKA